MRILLRPLAIRPPVPMAPQKKRLPREWHRPRDLECRRALGLRDKAAAPQLEPNRARKESRPNSGQEHLKRRVHDRNRGVKESVKLPASLANPRSNNHRANETRKQLRLQGSLNQATQRNLGSHLNSRNVRLVFLLFLSPYRFRQQRCPQQGTSFQRAK